MSGLHELHGYTFLSLLKHNVVTFTEYLMSCYLSIYFETSFCFAPAYHTERVYYVIVARE
jgi:hypothetical protein